MSGSPRTFVALIVAVGVTVAIAAWGLRVRPGPPPRPPAAGSATTNDSAPGIRDPAPEPRRETRRARPGLPIAGCVRYADGSPVEGGWLRLEPLSHEGPRRSARVRPGGRFRGVVDRSGLYGASLALPDPEGQRIVGSWRVEADTEDAVLTLDSEPPGGLTVHVIGPDGEPTSIAKLTVRREHGGVLVRLTVLGGIVTLTLPHDAGAIRIEVHAALQRMRKLGPGIFGPFDSRAGSVEIRLGKGLAIAGLVQDPDGQELAGAMVRAWPAKSASARSPVTTTDERGEFRLHPVDDQDYRIRASAPGHAFVELTARGGTSDLVLRLRPGVGARVLVLDPTGAPVPGARVMSTTTDASGFAVLTGLDPGRTFDLRVSPDRGRADLCERRVMDWRPADTTVVLPAKSEFSGRVVDEKGDPVRAAVHWRAGESRGSTSTDSQGRFVLEGLPGAEAWLQATFPRESIADGAAGVRVAAGANLLLRLDTRKAITVRLQVPEEIDSFVSVSASLVSDRTGEVTRLYPLILGARRFEFSGLERDETYTVRVRVRDRGLAGTLSGVRPGQVSATLKLRPGATICGRLRDFAAVTRIRIRAFSNGLGLQVKTDLTGRFELEGLTAGTWEIHGPGWFAEVYVEAGSTVEVEVPRSE